MPTHPAQSNPKEFKDFPLRLAAIRLARGFRKATGLSHSLGWSSAVITQYELGIRLPPEEKLMQLCDALKVTRKQLLGTQKFSF